MKPLLVILFLLTPSLVYAQGSNDAFWDGIIQYLKTWGGRLGLVGFVWTFGLIIADFFFDWEWLQPIMAKHKRKLFYAAVFLGAFALASTYIQEVVDWIKDPFQNINL